MGKRGPVPMADQSKRKGNDRVVPMTDLGAGAAPAPTLTQAARRKLHKEAREAWDTIVASPQAAHYSSTAWLAVKILVRFIDEFWKAETPAEMARLEQPIRMWGSKLGLTPDDQLRLRWRVAHAKDDDPPATAPATAKKRGKPKEDPRLRLVKDGS